MEPDQSSTLCGNTSPAATTFRRFLQDFWARLHPDLATQLHSRVLWRPASSSSPGVDLLRWPRSYAASSIVGCKFGGPGRFLRMPACKAFAHLQHARQSFCLSIAIFAVHSALPAKSVSALPPGADSHSRPLVEISKACPLAGLTLPIYFGRRAHARSGRCAFLTELAH